MSKSNGNKPVTEFCVLHFQTKMYFPLCAGLRPGEPSFLPPLAFLLV